MAFTRLQTRHAPPSDSSLAEVRGARLQIAAVLGGYFYCVLGLRATQHPHPLAAGSQMLLPSKSSSKICHGTK